MDDSNREEEVYKMLGEFKTYEMLERFHTLIFEGVCSPEDAYDVVTSEGYPKWLADEILPEHISKIRLVCDIICTMAEAGHPLKSVVSYLEKEGVSEILIQRLLPLFIDKEKKAKTIAWAVR